MLIRLYFFSAIMFYIHWIYVFYVFTYYVLSQARGSAALY